MLKKQGTRRPSIHLSSQNQATQVGRGSPVDLAPARRLHKKQETRNHIIPPFNPGKSSASNQTAAAPSSTADTTQPTLTSISKPATAIPPLLLASPPRPFPRQPPRPRPPPLPPTHHNPPTRLSLPINLPTPTPPNPPRPQRPNPPPLPLPAPHPPAPQPLLPRPQPLPYKAKTQTHPPHNPPLRRPHPIHPDGKHSLLALSRRLDHPPAREQHPRNTDLSALAIVPPAGVEGRYERGD